VTHDTGKTSRCILLYQLQAHIPNEYKHLLILNILDFWNKILTTLQEIIELGFAEKTIMDSIKVCHSVDEIFFDLENSALIASDE